MSILSLHAQPRGLSIRPQPSSAITPRAPSARAYLAFCWEGRRWAGCGAGSRGTAAGSCCAGAGPSCRRPGPASGGKPPPSAGWQTSCRHGPPSPGWSPARAPWRGTLLAADTRPCACKGTRWSKGEAGGKQGAGDDSKSGGVSALPTSPPALFNYSHAVKAIPAPSDIAGMLQRPRGIPIASLHHPCSIPITSLPMHGAHSAPNITQMGKTWQGEAWQLSKAVP